jgi:hypothetical protein
VIVDHTLTSPLQQQLQKVQYIAAAKGGVFATYKGTAHPPIKSRDHRLILEEASSALHRDQASAVTLSLTTHTHTHSVRVSNLGRRRRGSVYSLSLSLSPHTLIGSSRKKKKGVRLLSLPHTHFRLCSRNNLLLIGMTLKLPRKNFFEKKKLLRKSFHSL